MKFWNRVDLLLDTIACRLAHRSFAHKLPWRDKLYSYWKCDKCGRYWHTRKKK